MATAQKRRASSRCRISNVTSSQPIHRRRRTLLRVNGVSPRRMLRNSSMTSTMTATTMIAKNRLYTSVSQSCVPAPEEYEASGGATMK